MLLFVRTDPCLLPATNMDRPQWYNLIVRDKNSISILFLNTILYFCNFILIMKKLVLLILLVGYGCVAPCGAVASCLPKVSPARLQSQSLAQFKHHFVHHCQLTAQTDNKLWAPQTENGSSSFPSLNQWETRFAVIQVTWKDPPRDRVQQISSTSVLRQVIEMGRSIFTRK